MGVGVAQIAELLLQGDLVRVGVSMEAEKVNVVRGGGDGGGVMVERGTESVFVGVEKNIFAIVFVVAARWLACESEGEGFGGVLEG